MRIIRTEQNFVEFLELNNDGQIINSKGFQFGELYFEIKNKKVTFFLRDPSKPFSSMVWSIDIPFELDGVVYEDEDTASSALHNIMNDRFQEQLDQLKEDLAAEEARAQEAETQLDDKIDDESARAIAAENRLQDQVTELSGAVAVLDNRVTNVENDLSALTDTVNDEITRSTAKDAEHDVLISGLTSNLSSEIARATSAETELNAKIDAEIARAEAAEEDLDDKIDAEITRANAEETRIEGLITTEVTRSTNKDIEHDMLISGLTDASDALNAKIDKEIADRISGDTNLQNQLNAEIARAEGEESRIEGLINAEVTRSTAKDAAQDALISGLTTSLQNEINRAQGAENGLRSDLNTEISARTTADAEQLQRITALEVGKADKSDLNNYYTKAESDAKYVTKEYISGNTYTKAETEALISDFYDGAEYDSSTKRINFKHGEIIKTYIDATDFIKDGMVSNVAIENGYLVITFNTDSGKEAISIPLSDIFDPTNYYTKSEVDASQSVQDTKINTLSGDVTTISGDVVTLNEKVETISGEVQTISGEVQTISGEVQTISGEVQTISGNVQIISGEVQTIQSEIDDIDLSNYYTKSEVDVSQSAQDTKINEISGKTDSVIEKVNTLSGEVQTLSSEIDDIDLSNYYTKSESDGKYQLKGDYVTGAQLSAFTYDKATIDEKVSESGHFDPTQYYNKTATDALLDEKLDVTAYTPTDLSDYWTSAQTQSAINQATSGKQDTLTAGSGISIVNNVISATGGSSPIDAYTKAESDAKFATITNLNSHSGNTNMHVTAAEKSTWNNKSDFSGNYNDLTNKPTIPSYTAGDGIDITSNVISTVTKFWCGTQSQYDAISVKDPNTVYMIHE